MNALRAALSRTTPAATRRLASTSASNTLLPVSILGPMSQRESYSQTIDSTSFSLTSFSYRPFLTLITESLPEPNLQESFPSRSCLLSDHCHHGLHRVRGRRYECTPDFVFERSSLLVQSKALDDPKLGPRTPGQCHLSLGERSHGHARC